MLYVCNIGQEAVFCADFSEKNRSRCLESRFQAPFCGVSRGRDLPEKASAITQNSIVHMTHEFLKLVDDHTGPEMPQDGHMPAGPGLGHLTTISSAGPQHAQHSIINDCAFRLFLDEFNNG
jgi:hypothetical protein